MKNKVLEKKSQKKLKQKGVINFARDSVKKLFSRVGGAVFLLYEKCSDLMCEEIERESASVKVRMKIFFTGIFLTFLAFFISGVEMGSECFPLSLAILSASGVKKAKNSPASPRIIMALVSGAVLLSTLTMGRAGVLYFSLLTVLFIIRALITRAEFSESVSCRTLTSFFTAFLLGLMGALVSDFSLNSLVSWVTLMTVSPIFTYVFTPIFDMFYSKSSDTASREKESIAVAGVLFCVVFALSDFTLFGFAPAPLFAFCTAMCFSKKYGAVTGAVTGMILGAACPTPIFSVVIGLSGLISGLFFNSDTLALLVSILISTTVSVYAGGVDGFLTVVPEVLVATLLLWPMLSRVSRVERRVHKTFISPHSVVGKRVEAELEKISGGFSSLSEVFFAVSDAIQKPDRDSVKSMVESSCNAYCTSCSQSSKCWGREWRDTNEVIEQFTDKVIEKGTVLNTDVPEYFSLRCAKTSDMICDINTKYKSVLYDNADLKGANLIAGEYRTVSKLLKNTARTISRFPEEDTEMTKRAERALEKLKVQYGFVRAWGGRNTVIDVVGVSPEKMSFSTLDLISSFENECGVKFEEPEFITGEKHIIMRLVRRRAIHLECAKNTCSKKGESVNGDSISFFENDEGIFWALIADGMGSGRDAALTSRLASVFLEKLLTCTSDKSVIFEMLNRTLIKKNDECFTTLDLLEVDLYEKKASFIKAGAVASYVIRSDSVYKVNSETLPAGILTDFTAEQTRVSLRGGDVIIMVSDGVTSDGEVFDAEKYREERNSSASKLSKMILSDAVTDIGAKDDMSVVVVKVFED